MRKAVPGTPALAARCHTTYLALLTLTPLTLLALTPLTLFTLTLLTLLF
jgi:hypothetical protein